MNDIKNIDCRICENKMRSVFSENILEKYQVIYYYCDKCGLLKTESPYWLDEAYSEVISDTDTGIVGRNIRISNILEVILQQIGKESGQLLDVAGGYGLLTRLMRDKGFDCYTTDKYCQNIFAKSFEPDADFHADVLLAFEVLEHIDDPVDFLKSLFEKYNCKTLIFSTTTFKDSIPSNDWWYYSFKTGQHITFYQPKTLDKLADRLGVKYYFLKNDLHIFSDMDITNGSVLPIVKILKV